MNENIIKIKKNLTIIPWAKGEIWIADFSKCINNEKLSHYRYLQFWTRRIFFVWDKSRTRNATHQFKITQLGSERTLMGAKIPPFELYNIPFQEISEIKPLFKSSKSQIMFGGWPQLASAMHLWTESHTFHFFLKTCLVLSCKYRGTTLVNL